MEPLTSIIIPCYNAEKWIREAIESCIAQTYMNAEIIVVDDGSTDKGQKMLEPFLEEIKFISSGHRGAAAARNRGFEASGGKFIQFLDADDYLLPGKIATQVKFLQETGADGVYGDWQHRYELKDGQYKFGEPKISGVQKDVLESLLSGWWFAPGAFLCRRKCVESISGWDESLEAAQDRDFMIRIAMKGFDIRYLPECGFIYRRYGNVTLSTSSRIRWINAHRKVLDKARKRLSDDSRLTGRYKQALAGSYFHLARNYYDFDERKYAETMKIISELMPRFRPNESIYYNVAQRLFGFSTAERLSSIKRRLIKRVFQQEL